MNFLYNGPDELEKLEFMSRQQLLKEDKIMRDKLNNYVQLVAALTGQEVFLPVDDDEYTFVSVSDDELYDEESVTSVEYIIDEDEWDFESVNDEHGEQQDGTRLSLIIEGEDAEEPTTSPIENIELVGDTPADQIPPTPSQIIRKVKASLVEAGIEQRRLKKRKSRRLNGNNWTYDMARRRLKRELNRVHMRKAYKDAIHDLPTVTRSIQEEKEQDIQSSQKPATTKPTTTKAETRLTGTVFVGLLKSLEVSRKPSSKDQNGEKVKMSRSDQRLQAILQKHHHSLMNKKEKMNMNNSPFPSPPSITPSASMDSQNMIPPPPLTPNDMAALMPNGTHKQ